jgi:hypothetical protein
MATNKMTFTIICAAAALICGTASATNAIVSTGNNGLTIGNTTNAFSALGLHDAVGTTVPWGGSIALNEAGSWLNSAINGGWPKNGMCEFSALYQLLNASSANATFTVYISGGPFTAPYQNYGTFTIGAGQAVSFNAYLYLSAGNYPVTLRIDPGSSMLPSTSAYVIGSVNVAMTGACQAAKPVTPPPPPPPKADLVPQKGIMLGGRSPGAGRSVAWGGTIMLNPSDALLMSNGKCAFNVRYVMANIGKAASTSFLNRLYSGTQLVSQQTGLSLKMGEVRQVNTQMYLSPGLQTVRLMLDGDNTVAESDETNNSAQVSINVVSKCVPTQTVVRK